ncbi:class I SAM-dependent methyltransferase [Micromonospora sp. NPDC023956]|uniref:class I SAM-dependent methyltransferase n=1 Tax=Micromonospora sp. NPDC023956 TaxID=3155722 RepID=UPI0033EAE3DA
MSDASIETQQTYDAISTTYARVNSAVDSRLLADITALTTRLSPEALVADVGCGPGREIALLRERNLRVIGLDLSLGQLRTGGQPGVVQADMRRLPLQSGSVDAIWCQAALLHIPRREVPAVLHQFARALRRGGQLYLNVTEGDGEGWDIAATDPNADAGSPFANCTTRGLQGITVLQHGEDQRSSAWKRFTSWLSCRGPCPRRTLPQRRSALTARPATASAPKIGVDHGHHPSQVPVLT